MRRSVQFRNCLQSQARAALPGLAVFLERFRYSERTFLGKVYAQRMIPAHAPQVSPQLRRRAILIDVLLACTLFASAVCLAIIKSGLVPWIAGRLNAATMPFMLVWLIVLLGVPFFALWAVAIVLFQFHRASWARRLVWVVLAAIAGLVICLSPVAGPIHPTMTGFSQWASGIQTRPLQATAATAAGPAPTITPVDVWKWYVDEQTAPPAVLVPSSAVAPFIPSDVPFEAYYIPSTGATWLLFMGGRDARIVVIDAAPSQQPKFFHPCYEWVQVAPNVWAGVMFHP